MINDKINVIKDIYMRFISKKPSLDYVNILLILGIIIVIFGQFIILNKGEINTDEGVFYTIANGILNGKLPYLDYFDHKPPGIYYLIAFIFQLLGKTVIYARIGLLIINIFTAYIIFIIGKQLWDFRGGSFFQFNVFNRADSLWRCSISDRTTCYTIYIFIHIIFFEIHRFSKK